MHLCFIPSFYIFVYLIKKMCTVCRFQLCPLCHWKGKQIILVLPLEKQIHWNMYASFLLLWTKAFWFLRKISVANDIWPFWFTLVMMSLLVRTNDKSSLAAAHCCASSGSHFNFQVDNQSERIHYGWSKLIWDSLCLQNDELNWSEVRGKMFVL